MWPAGGTIEAMTHSSFWRAVLLGGALGDALGAPVEFYRRDEIRRIYGELDGLVHHPQRFGAITDDTQMTLFTAEAVIAGRRHDEADLPAALFYSYLRWLATQGRRSRLPEVERRLELRGLLWDDDDLHHVRAPGSTCLSALEGGWYGTRDHHRNNSKGCGGVMRAAPGGSYEAGVAIGAITHGHPTGYLTSGALAGIIAVLRDGGSLDDGLADVLARLRAERHGGETVAALEAAMAYRGDDIEELGAGWIAEEALAMGVWAALRAEGDVRRALLVAVDHSGDSDSTGSIAGNLLGAMHGERELPADWLAELEAGELIGRVGADLGASEPAADEVYPYI